MAKNKQAYFELKGDALEMVAARFKALSELDRLKILLQMFNSEETLHDLAAFTGLNRLNVHKHVTVLFEAGIIIKRRFRGSVYYTIADDSIPALLQAAYDSLFKQFGDKQKLFR
jgi:DNA-binding transcriptional ArsR family regulator